MGLGVGVTIKSRVLVILKFFRNLQGDPIKIILFEISVIYINLNYDFSFF